MSKKEIAKSNARLQATNNGLSQLGERPCPTRASACVVDIREIVAVSRLSQGRALKTSELKTRFRLPNNHETIPGKNEGRPAKAETGSTKSLELGVLDKAFRASNFGWEFIRCSDYYNGFCAAHFKDFLVNPYQVRLPSGVV